MVWILIGTFLGVFFLFLLIAGDRKYSVYIRNLSENEYMMKAIYPAGYYFLELIHYKYKSVLDQKRKKQCRVIYGQKYGDYYFVLNYAQKVSMMLFILPWPFLLYSFTKQIMVLFFGALLLFCAYLYYDMIITDVTTKRKDEIDRDWADAVSKLTLLINAGMTVTQAWEKVSETGESVLYQEMRTALLDIRNGIAERDAFMGFADRCMNIKVKKIMSSIVSNIDKGNRELVNYLIEQNSICWDEKKQYVKSKGEEASGKLLLPICIMMVGILIMVVVPMFASL